MLRLFAAILPLALAAGCAAPALEPAAGEDAEAGPTLPAQPAPTPVDPGHMPHMHDYWDGRERVTLFEGEVDPAGGGDPFAPFYGVPEGRLGSHAWRLPDGAVVMEGTGSMEITATWEEPLVTGLALSYRVGAAGEWSDPIPLASGDVSALAVTPATSDLPHMSTSRWEFLFTPDEAPGALMAPFDLRIEIVKMEDIMLFPGHPEHFDGKPEKTLHDREHAHEETSYAMRVPNLVTQGEFGEKTVVPDEIVPMETKAMRVEVTIRSATATPGEVSGIRFFYRGADTSVLSHPYLLPLEGGLDEGWLVYQFPVAPEQTDSPYAEESQWLFFVEPVTKLAGLEQEPDCGGCVDVAIEYHLRIVAYDHELEAYSATSDDEEGYA